MFLQSYPAKGTALISLTRGEERMIEWIAVFIEHAEYLGIFLLMVLENIFPPIPSEIILPLSSFSISRGELDPVFVLTAATLGSVAGAIFWYMIGKWVGEDKLFYFIERYGRWLAISAKDFHKTSRFFQKHCGKAVFLGRMIPAFRTLISIPAGLVNMSFGKFLFYSTLGTVLWSGALIYAGYALEEGYQKISEYVGIATNIIFAGIIFLYFYKLWTFEKPERQKEK
jgi:membrane protein DedA with SNARE-associated domain